MAGLLNKGTEAYSAERDNFVRGLRQFHDQKGTSFRHLPLIDGKEVDLYKLYWIVTAQGGFEKINSTCGWDELTSLFGFPENTGNGALLLKQLYLRYLDAYEKAHFVGDEADADESWYGDEEDHALRMRRHRAQRVAMNSVPLSYNHAQHSVPDECRAELNMATRVYRKTDYDRLALSLSSPLPNEQDFGVNVCTLLSNEGRHTLKLKKCPRLLDLLLAHAGVYNHANLHEYMNTLYSEARKYDLKSFWKLVCKDKSVRELMLQYPTKGTGDDASSSSTKTQPMSGYSGFARLKSLKEKALVELDGAGVSMDSSYSPQETSSTADEDLFAVGARLGTKDLPGQRVLQVATIVRNLSFEEDNAAVLGRNPTLLRFCLLCCCSDWSNLNQMGFDILSNIASEVVLGQADESCVTDVILSIITRGIGSRDRFQVIASLDVLNKLAQQDENEHYLGAVLSEGGCTQRPNTTGVYEQLAAYLTLHDIHLLISTLECLYNLSSLGESACNAIVRAHGALDSIVSLVTVEAQSYGPKACILMRVVETVPGAASMMAAAGMHHAVQSSAQLTTLTTAKPAVQQQPQQQQQQQAAIVSGGQVVQVAKAAAPVQSVAGAAQVSGQTNGPVTTLGTPVTSTATRQVVVTTSAGGQVTQIVRMQTQQPQQTSTNAAAATPTTAATPGQPQAAAQQPQQQPQQAQAQQQSASQQVQLRVCNDEGNRNFCLSWLRATYEAQPGCSIQHEIMYKQYLASLHKLGKRDVISAQLYAACVRSLFGGGVGPNKRQTPQGKVDSFFEGVRVRAQPLPLRIHIAPAAQQTQGATASQGQTAATGSTLQAASARPAVAAATASNSMITTAPSPAAPQAQLVANAVTSTQPANNPTAAVAAPAATPVRAPVVPALPLRASQTITTTPQQAVSVTSTTSTANHTAQVTQTTTTGPGSPILTNLLHRGSATSEKQEVVHKENDTNADPKHEPHIENGAPKSTVLDGQIMKIGKEGNSEPSSKGDMLAQLLEQKGVPSRDNVQMVNGVTSSTDAIDGKPVKVDYTKMNGGSVTIAKPNGAGNLKRPASAEPEGVPDAKNAHMEKEPTATNGIKTDEVLEAMEEKAADLAAESKVAQQRQVILKQAVPAVGGGAAAAAVMVGGGGGGDIGGAPPNKSMVILQPNSKVLVTAGSTAPSASVTTTVPPARPAFSNGQAVGTHVANGVKAGEPANHTQPQPAQSQPTTTMGSQGVPNPSSATTSTTPQSQAQTVVSSSNPSSNPQSAPAGAQAAAAAAVAAAAATSKAPPSQQQPPQPGSSRLSVNAPFLCEWQNCMKAFRAPKDVENHAIKEHCPLGADDIPCLWARCDSMKRKRFSLITHIQDRHCHPQLMKLMAVRRVQMATTGKSEVPLPPAPPPHPGYAPNAAYHAIKRHAAEFASPKAQAMGDEKEGPVTKSIRLTSALILKNLVIFSSLGRRRLKAYESHLSTVALSNVESSRTVSQILFDMSESEGGGPAPPPALSSSPSASGSSSS